jgi:putative ABC transport system permease protein
MDGIRRFWRRLLAAFAPDRHDDEASREIAAHRQLIEDDLIASGLPSGEARRRAALALGGVQRTRDRHRDARSFVWIEDARIDVRYALRLLARERVFAFTAILSLALGLGAATTIFTAVNALLLQAAPGVREPERLVDINRTTGEIGVEPMTYGHYDQIRRRATRVQDVYAYALNLTPMSLAPSPSQPAEAVYANLVTPNYFTALGVTPGAGRLFTEADREPVVVLSDRFWRRWFGGSGSTIGSTLYLGETHYTIVGIAPAEFHGNTVLAPDFWLPADRSRPLAIGLAGARLKPGVSRAEAAAEIETIGRTLEADVPSLPDPRGRSRRFGLSVTRSSPIPSGVRMLVGGFLALLMGIVTLVLVIACTNIAGVLLARGAARSKETAVRIAIGVGRARLIRQLLTETLVLFTLAGAAGLLVSRVMTAAIMRALPAFPLPATLGLALDARVTLFALGLSVLAALVFGLTPAIQASKVDVLTVLKVNEQGSASSQRLRRGFVVAQVALSVVLVVVAGLMARALGRAASVDRGFDARGVEVVSLDLALAGYTAAVNGLLAGERLLAGARALPGVTGAALAALPPSGGLTGIQVEVPGAIAPDGRPFFQVGGNTITPGYFATIRLPLTAGRDFNDRDSAAGDPVAIVSEAVVRRFWKDLPAVGAIGRQIHVRPMLFDRASGRPAAAVPFTIVGVVGDLRNGGAPSPYVYLPLAQRYMPALRLLARSADGRRLAADLRAVVADVDKRLPVLSSDALSDESGPVITQLRVSAAVAGSLSVLAIVLAAIGVYGVTAFMVIRRTREIGIRVALGAGRPAIVRMALGEGVRLVAIGSALGLAGGAGAGRLLRHLLFGVPALDPLTFVATASVFALVALAATYAPIRRALRVNPTQALRYE